MVYIFTALYCEAHIFIKQFNLIKNQERTWYQEFYNETDGIRLAITGVGEIRYTDQHRMISSSILESVHIPPKMKVSGK